MTKEEFEKHVVSLQTTRSKDQVESEIVKFINKFGDVVAREGYVYLNGNHHETIKIEEESDNYWGDLTGTVQ